MATGQNIDPQMQEELQLIERIYYDRDIYIASDEEMAKLNDLVDEMRADKSVNIQIIGHSDKWGGVPVNDRFSFIRAMFIADWLIKQRVSSTQIEYNGDGVDTEARNDAEARRVDVMRVVMVEVEATPEPEVISEPTPEPEIISESEPEPEVIQEPEPEPEPISEPEPTTTATTRNTLPITIRTNLFYWLGGLMNIGAEYKTDESDFGYLLNMGYSFFGGADWEHALGGWFVSPEVRYYIPTSPEWFVGVQALAGGYNFKLGDTGRQGSVFGGGVTGGYKLTLTERFDMDFNLGLGYGAYKYDLYHHESEVNVRDVEGIRRGYLLPQAGVNLIWKIK